jgi:hypothetical protein
VQLLAGEAKREIAAASTEEASANVSIAAFDLNQMKLYAPIAGVISQPSVKGRVHHQGSPRPESAGTIFQFDPIQVVGQVPYDLYIARRAVLGAPKIAAEKLEFALLLPTGDIYPSLSHLVAGSYEFDAASQTVAITMEFPNPDFLLRPGFAVHLQSRLAN